MSLKFLINPGKKSIRLINNFSFSEHQEVCENMKFIVECSNDYNILTEQAKYGRMRIGKCVKNDLGYLGCQNEVLNLVDRWCSGLQQCEIVVPNLELGNANTACLADLNSYLEVDYTCVPGRLKAPLYSSLYTLYFHAIFEICA